MGAVVVRAMRPADAAAAFAVRASAFSGQDPTDHDPADDGDYAPLQHRLVAEVDGEVVGHLASWPLQQFLLGQPVSIAGVAGVSVLPHARGRGVAAALAEQAVRDAHDRGDAASVLFPNTQGVYRRCGWEVAGTWSMQQVRCADLARLPRPDTDVDLRPARQDDLDDLVALERRVVARDHGRLARGPERLAPLLRDPEVRSAVASVDGALTGYALWTQPGDTTPGRDRTHLAVRAADVVAADRPTWLALWRLLASHASVATWVRYAGPPVDPLHVELGTQVTEPAGSPWHWMTRVVDLDRFLAARGWPSGAAVAIPLTIHDPVLPDRRGVLEVADGTAQWTDTDDDGAHVDVGALSSLLTGGFSARQLAWLGRIDATGDQLTALDEACRAPTPWTSDHF